MTFSSDTSEARGFEGAITTPCWNLLRQQGALIRFQRTQTLLFQGQTGKNVIALHKGRAKISFAEAEGREALLAIRGPGDLLGEYAQRDGNEHMASVIAMEDGEATIIDSAKFEEFISRFAFNRLLESYVLGKVRQVGKRMWQAANLVTEQRLALLLLEIAEAARPGSSSTIPMTQEEMAGALGIARSSVTRHLAEWKKHGIISPHQTRIAVLDYPALVRRANY